MAFPLCLPCVRSVRWDVDGVVVGSGTAVTTVFGAPAEYKAGFKYSPKPDELRWRKAPTRPTGTLLVLLFASAEEMDGEAETFATDQCYFDIAAPPFPLTPRGVKGEDI